MSNYFAPLIRPKWPVPPLVQSWTSTRQGGSSMGVYAGLNLANHVGDDPQRVASNRDTVVNTLKLNTAISWLRQVHGTDVAINPSDGCCADAVYADSPGHVCAVLTADCLPLLVADAHGQEVAAIHAGWKGMAAGVIESTLKHFKTDARDIMVWLGPAIGATAFEVGSDVVEAFGLAPVEAASVFRPSRADHYWADLYGIARIKLCQMGIEQIYGGEYCTYTQSDLFYSFRRDGVTGRMASLIWLE